MGIPICHHLNFVSLSPRTIHYLLPTSTIYTLVWTPNYMHTRSKNQLNCFMYSVSERSELLDSIWMGRAQRIPHPHPTVRCSTGTFNSLLCQVGGSPLLYYTNKFNNWCDVCLTLAKVNFKYCCCCVRSRPRYLLVGDAKSKKKKKHPICHQ